MACERNWKAVEDDVVRKQTLKIEKVEEMQDTKQFREDTVE